MSVVVLTFWKVFHAIVQFLAVTLGMKVNIIHSSMRIFRLLYSVEAVRGDLEVIL